MKCPKCGDEMRSYAPWYEPPENRYDECRSCGHTEWPYWPDEEENR